MQALAGSNALASEPVHWRMEDEAARLEALHRYDILDTPPEEQFDRIAQLARVLFDTPIAAITLVDQDRQWFKASVGLNTQQTPRQDSFCSRAMENDGVFVVPDAREDPRFAENPLVTDGPHIRFYAGAALHSSTGANLGAVCVISDTPRDDFSAADQGKLQILGGHRGDRAGAAPARAPGPQGDVR